MLTDRRHDERLTFCMEECKGSFTLAAGDEEYEIEDVHDISLSGMGFEMSGYLDPDTSVVVSYEENDRTISVRGRIVWCQEHATAHGIYQFGMLFDYSARDENSQLLLAVRDYIDTTETAGPSDELDFG